MKTPARGVLFRWYHSERLVAGVGFLQDISLSDPCRVNAVRFAQDVSQIVAPGEIRTPDPQIPSLEGLIGGLHQRSNLAKQV
jgi:hypothetical protein